MAAVENKMAGGVGEDKRMAGGGVMAVRYFVIGESMHTGLSGLVCNLDDLL